VLLLTVHHLAMDVVSWHIVLGYLADAWIAVRSGTAPKAPMEFTSYRQWSQLMQQRASSHDVLRQRDYLAEQVSGADPELGSRHADPSRDTWGTLQTTAVPTPVAVTTRLLASLNKPEGVYSFLLSALAVTVASWRKQRGQDSTAGTLVSLEGHGRADGELDADTSGTVGWFTTVYPVRVATGEGAIDVDRIENDVNAARQLLAGVARHIDEIPYQGLDYGLLRYVRDCEELSSARDPQIQFNYVGRMDISGIDDQPWSLITDARSLAVPPDSEPDLPLRFAINIGSAVMTTPEGPQLLTNWQLSSALFTPADASRLTQLWQRSVAALAGALDG